MPMRRKRTTSVNANDIFNFDLNAFRISGWQVNLINDCISKSLSSQIDVSQGLRFNPWPIDDQDGPFTGCQQRDTTSPRAQGQATMEDVLFPSDSYRVSSTAFT